MPESLPTLLGSLLSVHSRRGAQRPLLFLARTQTNFLKSLRRCDRKGDVAIVLEVPPACPSTPQRRSVGLRLRLALPRSPMRSISLGADRAWLRTAQD
jgi:hypothetical protein